MSAIAGIFKRNGELVTEQEVLDMLHSMSHRPNDYTKVWVDGAVAIGCRAMHVTPESLYELLPYDNGKNVITADARIDNREELLEKLNIPNQSVFSVEVFRRSLYKEDGKTYREGLIINETWAEIEMAKNNGFLPLTDAELILAAYEKWGEDCCKYLLGDFAFAIWDKQKQELFCGRDQVGIRSFYYSTDINSVSFCTEIKGLAVANSSVLETINTEKTVYTESLRYDYWKTIYEDVKILKPAHYISFNKKTFSEKKYWQLHIRENNLYTTEEAVLKDYGDLLNQVIQSKLRSAFEIGTTLSGGLDSTLITLKLKKLLPTLNFQTYSIYIPGEDPPHDDVKYLDFIKQNFSFNYNFIDPFKEISTIKKNNSKSYLDEPPHISNDYINEMMFEKAKQTNVRLLFDGYGGDSTHLYGAETKINWAYTFNFKRILLFYKSQFTDKSYLWYYFQTLKYFISTWLKIINNQLFTNKLFNDKVQTNFPDYAKKITKYLVSSPYLYHKEFIKSGMYALSFTNQMDIISNRYSVKVVFPYLDIRLMAFCLNLPLRYKFLHYESRGIQKYWIEKLSNSKFLRRNTKATFDKLHNKILENINN